MVNEQALEVLAVVALAGFVGLMLFVHVRRAQLLLESWAEENGYQLLEAEHRLFRKGPYIWSGRRQVVYRVRARDQHGAEQQGRVSMG